MSRTLTEGPRQRRSSRALTALILALGLLAMVISGCSSIPVTGPVGTLPARNLAAEDEAPNFNVTGPTGGESPDRIVRGFFRGGLSAADNYAVAREYMTPELAASWDATERTLVVDNDPEFEQVDDAEDHLTADVRVTRILDGSGVRQDRPKGENTELEFSLRRVDGEWRLSKAPNGIVVESSSFEYAFSPVTLYFYSDSKLSTLVPDVRWMAKRQGRSAAVATALLEGPAPYLKKAVYSAFPEGSKLSRASVPVENKVATVDVPESVLTDASDETRQRMLLQLERSLVDSVNVNSVQLTADQNAVEVGPRLNEPRINPAPDGAMVGLRGDEVVRYEDGALRQVEGGDKVGTALSDPTMSPVQEAYAVLTGGSRQLKLLTQDASVRTLFKGTQLVAPSYDSHSWVWTAQAVPGSPVLAVRAAGGSPVRLEGAWLGKGTVTGLRVSADGTRLAVTVKRSDGDHLLIAGIQRDKNGKPVGLATPLELTLSVKANRVAWASDSELVVTAPGPKNKVVAEQVSLERRSSTWTMLLGMTSLAVAPGTDRAAIAVVNDETVLAREGTTWRQVAKELGVNDLSYRG
ncbi:LpqB family beta-propeller domain-containing protein [Galactobacter caseinivorans]|uniref:GerMN domain-containing protein n=1 Tax=Galactobacter caseinivorans TaxID=2676123 RepID=A0A496PM97_9MICC|nr:LpqB family beta-propeller domain-containing protein [Galactobacter caseinivorans]RKW71643.1 hypothetical protein DWQ67_02050 [Galactobacter caseinivorans]